MIHAQELAEQYGRASADLDPFVLGVQGGQYAWPAVPAPDALLGLVMLGEAKAAWERGELDDAPAVGNELFMEYVGPAGLQMQRDGVSEDAWSAAVRTVLTYYLDGPAMAADVWCELMSK